MFVNEMKMFTPYAQNSAAILWIAEQILQEVNLFLAVTEDCPLTPNSLNTVSTPRSFISSAKVKHFLNSAECYPGDIFVVVLEHN